MIPKTKVAKTKYFGNIKNSIHQVIGLLGGIVHFINAGDTVLIKPNFNTADPYPASTSLDFLEAVIKLIYQARNKLNLPLWELPQIRRAVELNLGATGEEDYQVITNSSD